MVYGQILNRKLYQFLSDGENANHRPESDSTGVSRYNRFQKPSPVMPDMTKTRKSSPALNRALVRAIENTQQPIYLLAISRKLTVKIDYMNQTCLDWIGVEADQVRGTVCRYSSDDIENPIEQQVAGLCPPPDWFSDPQHLIETGQSRCQIFCLAVDGESDAWRWATAFPLIDQPESTAADASQPRQLRGVLVVADAATTAHPEPTDPLRHANANAFAADSLSNSPDSREWLHQTIAAIRSVHQQRYCVMNLIGSSPIAERLRRQAVAMAELPTDILITGPVGSGRERLAWTIATGGTTEANPDSSSPLPVPLYCVLADEQLIGETLDSFRQSHFRDVSKSGGPRCLMLLDIDKLSSPSLSLVNDFLENRPANTRIISTSEQSLLSLARQNRFPAHLAHQLATLEVPLVSLKERQVDIPLIAQGFVEHHNATNQRQFSGFDPAAMQMLVEYDWPGNVEELQQVVVESCQSAESARIAQDDLPTSFRHAIKAQQIGTQHETMISLDAVLEEFELELIQRAVRQSRGNKTRAAELLGISRARLLRRLEQFRMSDADQPENDQPTTDGLLDSSAFEEWEETDA